MSKVNRTADRVWWWCPGCHDIHAVTNSWSFSGTDDRPTINPSVLVTYRHPKGYSEANPAPLGYNGEYVEDICHSFIRDGKIEFLTDCFHGLAGQTVEMPDWHGFGDGDGR
jgi:hypothetical protein